MAIFPNSPKRYAKDVEKFWRDGRAPRKPKHSVIQWMSWELEEFKNDDFWCEDDEYRYDEPSCDVESNYNCDEEWENTPTHLLYEATYTPWGVNDIDKFLHSTKTNYRFWLNHLMSFDRTSLDIAVKAIKCCALMEYVMNMGGLTGCCLQELGINIWDTVFWMKMLRAMIQGAQGLCVELPSLNLEYEDMHEDFDESDTHRYYNYCEQVMLAYVWLYGRIEVVIC
jgi:hypothetical protein